MAGSKHKVDFTYKISGVETTLVITGEIKSIQGLMKPNGFLYDGFGTVDDIPFKEIDFNGYLYPKCITDDIIDFLKNKLKLEHGKKVHFDYLTK